MKPSPFDYVRPATLSDAIATLSTRSGTAVAIAGGQSMLPLLSLRMAPADIIVDVGRLGELRGSKHVGETIQIGAASTHAEIEDGKVEDPSGGLMQRVASGIAYRAVRNYGTIGGSVALADPAADWPVCLIALGATALISGPNGERREAVVDLVQGPYSTSLQPGEIITAFEIERFAVPPRWGYAKVVRKTGAFAMAIGCVVHPAIAPPSAVLGGMGTAPRLLPRLADTLAHTPTDGAIADAIAADISDVAPDADAYQKRLYAATLLQAVREAYR